MAESRWRRLSREVIARTLAGLPLDALTHCGLIVADSPAWCELGAVAVARGKADRTVVTLEDL